MPTDSKLITILLEDSTEVEIDVLEITDIIPVSTETIFDPDANELLIVMHSGEVYTTYLNDLDQTAENYLKDWVDVM